MNVKQFLSRIRSRSGNRLPAKVTEAKQAKARTRPVSKLHRWRNRWGVIFVLPAVAYLTIVVIGPVFFNFWISLHKWNPLSAISDAKWVGFKNYEYILTIDKQFLLALRNSAIYALSRVIGNVTLGLGLALLMNAKRLKGLKVWRVALFLPIATSPAVLSKIWGAMYHPDYGIFNAVLGVLGFQPVGWLTNPGSALWAIIIIGLYQYVGYYAIIFLASLQGIPEDIIDAARVDGAGSLRLLWNIIIPLLRPVIVFVVVVSTIFGLQVFDIVWATTRGGPANATSTVVLQMYRNVFVNGRAGMGAAMAITLFGIVIIFAIVQMRMMSRDSYA